MDVKRTAFKWALRNAVEHGGRASAPAVLGKVLAEDPELRAKVQEVRRVVEAVVEEVNAMSLDAQRAALEEFQPEEAEKKQAAERALPPLPNAVQGKVVTRLPPEPSGFMHLGHALAGLINEYYARRYGGKLWLRFEDTNPRKVKKVYYESFRKGYEWLGIVWDFEKNNSDDMNAYYDYGLILLKRGFLYACFCTPEEMHRQRAGMTGCVHRSSRPEDNLEEWDKVLHGRYGEGDVSFRLKGSLDSPNTAMRDPVLFRIIDHPHPLTGGDYRLWPTYDFAAAVQDALCGITHVLRSSEFAFRDELQNYLRDLLGLPNPVYVEFSRFEFKGTPTSKRVIRDLIERKLVDGWDDPRLSTVEAIRRRGLVPQAIREFTMSYAGISQAKKEYDWSLLYSLNRKIIDPHARRLFFVKNPVRLVLENFQGASVEIPYHPSSSLGSRVLEAGTEIYISGDDAAGLARGDVFRCKLLANVRVVEVSENRVVGEVVGDSPQQKKIIQWVPEDGVEVAAIVYGMLLNEDGSVNSESVRRVEGLGEKAVNSVKVDEVVQFERFGFCRRDRADKPVFIYCHD
ncbi:MAG: glutamate--tRNA ligase [Candidatus Caldarchaeum sp.]